MRRVTDGVKSRRLFMAGAAAATVLPAFSGSPKALAQDTAPAPTPPPPPTPDEVANLATRNDTAMRLMVEVRVNGAGPYNFVVDTGAERSVIADNVAADLALVTSGRATVEGIVRTLPADLVTVTELAYGPFTRANLQLPVLPRKLMEADGYLGLDAINGSRVTFDFKNRALRIEQPKAKAPPTSETETIIIHAPGIAGRLRAEHCVIDGVYATVFIDSGAELSIGNSALKAALDKGRHPPVDMGKVVLTGITGGEAEGRIIPVHEIRIQNLTFSDGTVVISDAPDFDNWHLATKPALLIGMDYLRQFASVSIDYRRKEIRFELARELKGPPGVRIAQA